MENIVTIIIIIIFVVFPLIKKMMEALSGGEAKPIQQKRESLQEVKDYLEKMRTTNQTPKQYRAPATYPQSGYEQRQKSLQKKTKATKEESARSAEQVLVELDAEKNKKLDVVHEVSTVNVSVQKIDVIHKIMSEPRFSDMHKIIIFSEILKRPKSLSKN